jgi:dTDP-4-dehydrorhamnose reductase
MRIVVTGKHGQVVQCLQERAPLAGHEIIALGRPEFDLAEPTTLGKRLAELCPDALVSAAAYTAVDRAESEPIIAHAINGTAPRVLAEAASRLNVPLVQISTDYVFDGSAASPYRETDAVAPLGVYGQTKLAGENAVLEVHPGNSAVLRSAWVFSPFGNNFVKTMLRLASDRHELGVVSDQIGNPTCALDIADAIVRVCENLARDPDPALRGTFHMAASGAASWADFAQAIFTVSQRYGGPFARVRPIATSEYPTAARRPANSRLDCEKLFRMHGIRLPDWRVSTEHVVARLVTQSTQIKELR